MTNVSKIALMSVVALLAGGVFRGQAIADDQYLHSVIDQLSAPLVAPIQFPLLEADDLFTQDNAADVVAIEQVFSAYVFYNDAHDGPDLASLYLPNGVDDHGYNNGSGGILPNYGVGGLGCVLTGTNQIATYISDVYGNTPVLPYPDHTHHVVTSKLVQVVGDDAMMQAVWYGVVNTSATPSFSLGGVYLTTFKRTADGWKIRTNHVIWDQPLTSTICSLSGPIPSTVP
jgi:hypothetical protein